MEQQKLNSRTDHANGYRNKRRYARPQRNCIVILLCIGCAGMIGYCRLALRMNIVSTHFAYVPIVLAGLWWGRKALWVAAVLGVFIIGFAPFISIEEHLGADLARVFFFMLVAFAIGTASEKLASARKAETASQNELRSTQRRLVEAKRLAGLAQLSAGVAHEINNPLGTILLYACLLLKKVGLDEESRQEVQTIAQEATRCRDIVR